jgi:integrase/recombinase XerD
MRIDTTRILTHDEIRLVVAHLKRKRRYVSNCQSLVVFRLATCCGLRASEIAGLRLDDLRLECARPHIRLPKAITKGCKSRNVPLWWDQGTLDDLRTWKMEQVSRVGTNGYIVSTQSIDALGHQLDRRSIRRIFIRACKPLGRESVTVHDGRHTFCSLALSGGRGLIEVRDAAGHSNISTTSVYLHAVPDNGRVGTLFA